MRVVILVTVMLKAENCACFGRGADEAQLHENFILVERTLASGIVRFSNMQLD
jgi:hypothetical protein